MFKSKQNKHTIKEVAFSRSISTNCKPLHQRTISKLN